MVIGLIIVAVVIVGTILVYRKNRNGTENIISWVKRKLKLSK